MSLHDRKALYDGFQTLEGGMDGGVAPSLVSRNRYAYGSNVIHRGGFVATRPGWVRRTLRFADTETEVDFEGGRFQGAYSYQNSNGDSELILSISGHLFRIRVDQFYRVDDISIDLDRDDLPRVWFEQAEEFLVRQDNQSAALIYDGSSVRRIDPSSNPKELPVGNAMVYSQGRLWVVLPNRLAFVAGDLVGGSSGTPAFGGRDSVLKFTENSFLNGGGAFGVPGGAGFINGLKSIANLDSSLGQGPTQVACDNAVFSVNAPFDRTQWQNLDYPIQSVSLLGSGFTSHDAMVLVNGDIWGRSPDGIRSFQIARRDFGSWVNTPLSNEITPIIDADNRSLLQYASGVLFDNRLVITVSPRRVWDRGVVFRGLVGLDFHPVSGMMNRTAPSYDGLFTGLDFFKLLSAGDRVFAIVLGDGEETIELWELTRNDAFDNQSTPVAASITTRSLFSDTGFNLKEIQYADLWIDDLIGDADFVVQYRTDQDQCWHNWHSFTVSAKYQTCGTNGCVTPQNWQPQYRSRIRLPKPTFECDSLTGKPYSQGFEAQARITWTGHVRILKFRMCVHDLPETPKGGCAEDETEDTVGISCCLDPYEYSSV